MRWTRATTRTLVKMVIFALACMLAAALVVVRIGNVHFFSHNAGYTAELADASGLIAGDNVKVAGVTVGRVDAVSVRHGLAVVHFDLQPSLHLRSSTMVGLQWLDVIGQKVLYLYPGSSGRVLRPGSTLPLSQNVSDASVGQLLNTLGPFLQAIDPKQQNAFLQAIAGALQGENVQVHSLIGHTATVASSVGSLSQQLGAVIDNLDTVVTAIAQHRGDVATLSDNLAGLSQSLAQRNGLLDSTVGNLGQVEHELAGLLGSNRSTLDSIVSSLNGIAGDLARHRRQLADSLHTLPAGLAPYQQISSYGQWFQIDPVYTCLANETTCSYQQPTNPPGGSGPLPGAGGGTGPGLPAAGGAAAPGIGGVGGPSRTIAGSGISRFFGDLAGGTP